MFKRDIYHSESNHSETKSLLLNQVNLNIYLSFIENEAATMNIRILLGTFTILLINKLNGRFLLVNVGGPHVDDPDVDDEDRHRIGAPDVDDDNDPSRIGNIVLS